jgi:methionine synthase II (cobalamin-independent)
MVPTDGGRTRPQDLSGALVEAWTRTGLPLRSLADVVVTPACGLAAASPDVARAVQRAAVETARELEELSAR